jgi:MFS family permease
MSIFPYAYRMIESFDIANNENQTSMYAGMLITAFAFAEFSTGMLWGRISDTIGRKPVLVMGLIGTAISMVSFGFSRSLPAAIISRALGGLLNGNVGVLQTTVAELVTKKEHQPRAYSIMPFVWCLGSIIGPAMGGALAMPCEAYPWLFPKGGLFDAYPFLLPNLVSVGVLICGITTGFLFLEETHTTIKNDRRDVGLECGDLLLKKLFNIDSIRTVSDDSSDADSAVTLASEDDVEACPEKTKPVAVFNRQVILIIIGYGILA